MPKNFFLNLSATAAYSHLLIRVKQILIEGQRRIEQERVRTYWETGKIIHEHTFKHADRSEYGAQVIDTLAKDLEIHKRLLHYYTVKLVFNAYVPPAEAGASLDS